MNDLADYLWLVSPAAETWLNIEADDPLRLISRLRKNLSAQRAHLVAEQIELRHRAREKFPLATKMFFTRKGVEQATDEQISRYKGVRFPVGEQVVDLCCGIGGDFIAFCHRGPATGIDRDEVMALFARANAEANGFATDKFNTIAAEAHEIDLAGVHWHCDPDRRPAGRRATRGELFEPSLDVLDGLLRKSPHAAIKLAPATDAPIAWQQAAELQWLESRGECRQQVAWFGDLAKHPGHRSATIISSNGQSRTVICDANDFPPVAVQIGRYLYEPAAAVLAAKLTTELCCQHNLTPLNPGIAYLTGDNQIDDLALATFEILDILPFDRKQLRTYCREHALSRLEIKKRGVEIDPAKLRQEIVAPGDNAATILVAPFQQRTHAFITRRLNLKNEMATKNTESDES